MDQKALDHLFTYHPPTTEQLFAYEKLRDDARSFARSINVLVPDGPDKSAAIRLLRECLMTSNAAIACHIPREEGTLHV